MVEMAEAGESSTAFQETGDFSEFASQKLKSPYFDSAMYTVHKEVPEREREIAGVLRSVDDLMADHLSVFESKEFPGVIVPYSRVPVKEVVEENFGLGGENQEPGPKKTEIVFCGFAKPPGGHPYTAGDIVYDRVLGAIPEIVGPIRRSWKKPEPVPNVEVISLGSPNGMGGKVTAGWVDGLEKEGFDEYAKLYAEMVRSLEGVSESEVLFNGMSMGATVAEKTARNLSSWKAIKVIMDNPVTSHGYVSRIIKSLQIPAGFLGEAGLKTVFNKNVKMEVAQEEEFNNQYRQELIARGISGSDSTDQSELKGTAVRTDIIMMVKGTPLDNDEVRVYIRRGNTDPTTISPVNLARVFARSIKSKGIIQDTKRLGIKEYPIQTTHFINRWRVGKWGRVVDMAKDIDKPFPETTDPEARKLLGLDQPSSLSIDTNS